MAGWQCLFFIGSFFSFVSREVLQYMMRVASFKICPIQRICSVIWNLFWLEKIGSYQDIYLHILTFLRSMPKALVCKLMELQNNNIIRSLRRKISNKKPFRENFPFPCQFWINFCWMCYLNYSITLATPNNRKML